MSDEGQWCDPGYCQLAEVSNYANELKEKLAECEARLGKAVEALEEISEYDTGATAGLAYTAKHHLTEIKGESHE